MCLAGGLICNKIDSPTGRQRRWLMVLADSCCLMPDLRVMAWCDDWLDMLAFAWYVRSETAVVVSCQGWLLSGMLNGGLAACPTLSFEAN